MSQHAPPRRLVLPRCMSRAHVTTGTDAVCVCSAGAAMFALQFARMLPCVRAADPWGDMPTGQAVSAEIDARGVDSIDMELWLVGAR